ncbi:hypothetical protein O3S81_01120 [Agrobacterium sp. SOY23]|nr:hypothetical protein [Agrobacterium sp. SOY23]MCZ4428290.1 hypothetical protein [Agrobacterium sp. SOY23]
MGMWRIDIVLPGANRRMTGTGQQAGIAIAAKGQRRFRDRIFQIF